MKVWYTNSGSLISQDIVGKRDRRTKKENKERGREEQRKRDRRTKKKIDFKNR